MPALARTSPVVDIRPAPAGEALAHFTNLLRFETDCWDVHAAMRLPDPGFVLLDVRSPQSFATGHIEGAVNLPYRLINETTLSGYADDTVFVVYCTGPHCNGADRAAVGVARLGRPVKKMIGGVAGWLHEGFSLVAG